MTGNSAVSIDWTAAQDWADYYLEKKGAGIPDDLNLARAYLAVLAELRESKKEPKP